MEYLSTRVLYVLDTLGITNSISSNLRFLCLKTMSDGPVD